MLIHGYTAVRKPERAVVLGSQGFIGASICDALEAAGITTLRVNRQCVDLLANDAAMRLVQLLEPSDVLVFAAAKAPCKDVATLRENLLMVEAVTTALRQQTVMQVVYVSSDAVYKDSLAPLNEASCAEPGSLHGIMHLAREISLRQAYAGPLALLRPTLVYGLADPHNGYGPNRFGRLARAGKEIVLFGDGEERRDHVSVNDVAKLTTLIVQHRSAGIANAVSGQVVSFREIAEFASLSAPSPVAVRGSVRVGPMPHQGYRAFDNSMVLEAFPGFTFVQWREGLADLCDRTRTGSTT